MRKLLLLLLLATPLAAQTIAPSTIIFTGASNLPSPALLALSGLHPGATLTQPDIEAAMNRMADTGLFSAIRFTTTPGTLHFELTPQDATHMRPVAFTNFPWYTAPQLLAALHAQQPLFNGTVPIEGDFAAQVATALQAILKQNQSLDVKVSSIGHLDGTLDYSITSPPVVVGQLLVEDARFDSAPALADIRTRVAGQPYVTGISEEALRKNLADAYLDLGYLDQRIDPLAHAAPRTGSSAILVDLTGTAHPGEQYKVSRLELPKPTGAVSEAEIDRAILLKPGSPTSVTLVKSAQAQLDLAFQNRGYLDAATTVTAAQDSAAHTIAYTFATAPGYLYTMRHLVFAAAISAQQQSILTQSWKLAQGATYDGNTAAAGLHQPAVLALCGGPRIEATLIPDQATHEVDVNLTCSLKP